MDFVQEGIDAAVEENLAFLAENGMFVEDMRAVEVEVGSQVG